MWLLSPSSLRCSVARKKKGDDSVATITFYVALQCCSAAQQGKKKGDDSVATITFYAALQCCSAAQQGKKKKKRRRQPLLPSPSSLHCSAARKKEEEKKEKGLPGSRMGLAPTPSSKLWQLSSKL